MIRKQAKFMSKIRDSRIELIRIISMILIVLFHLTMYSGFSIVEDNLSFNYILHTMFGIFEISGTSKVHR